MKSVSSKKSLNCFTVLTYVPGSTETRAWDARSGNGELKHQGSIGLLSAQPLVLMKVKADHWVARVSYYIGSNALCWPRRNLQMLKKAAFWDWNTFQKMGNRSQRLIWVEYPLIGFLKLDLKGTAPGGQCSLGSWGNCRSRTLPKPRLFFLNQLFVNHELEPRVLQEPQGLVKKQFRRRQEAGKQVLVGLQLRQQIIIYFWKISFTCKIYVHKT